MSTDERGEGETAPSAPSAPPAPASSAVAGEQRGLGSYLIPDCGSCVPGFKREFGPGLNAAIATLTEGLPDGDETGKIEWDTPWYMFWADIPICFLGYFCFPCVYSRNAESVTGETCEGHFLTSVATCCLAPCYLASVRTKMRAKYDLQGSRQTDCLLTCFCFACVQCQQARELRLRDENYNAYFQDPTERPLME